MNTAVVQKKPETTLADLPNKQQGLIATMASRYAMDPQQFAAAVKKTAMPGNATNEEFAAFMMVAHEYNLNPLLKEIYAFPRKGGGVVPMVSIDGWINLINSNPQMNGFEQEMHYDDKQQLVACTTKIWRKDRQLPTVVTEYLAECYRGTEPWKMKHRMLRHKSLIQAARYAFGLAGVYDEDEARDISEIRDVTPPPRPEPKDFIVPANKQIAAATVSPVAGSGEAAGSHQPPDEPAATEWGVADWYQAGSDAKLAGEPKTLPDNIPADLAMQDAWLAGYDETAPEKAAAQAATA